MGSSSQLSFNGYLLSLEKSLITDGYFFQKTGSRVKPVMTRYVVCGVVRFRAGWLPYTAPLHHHFTFKYPAYPVDPVIRVLSLFHNHYITTTPPHHAYFPPFHLFTFPQKYRNLLHNPSYRPPLLLQALGVSSLGMWLQS